MWSVGCILLVIPSSPTSGLDNLTGTLRGTTHFQHPRHSPTPCYDPEVCLASLSSEAAHVLLFQSRRAYPMPHGSANPLRQQVWPPPTPSCSALTAAQRGRDV
eukprot:750309-Hanusia_phi.AAC.4